MDQLSPEQLKVPVPFEIVGLTDLEKKAAHQKGEDDALQAKWDLLEKQRRAKLVEIKRQDVKRPWSQGELYELAKWRATQMIRARTGDPVIEFEPVDFQKNVIVALTHYFTGSKEFEELHPSMYNTTKLPFSLNKGIWLWGNPGVGKTLMMEMFNRNKRLCYDVVQCPKICYEYVKHGDMVFEGLINVREVNAPDISNFLQKQKGICYNDVGTEPLKSNFYANPLNVMEHIMLQTYENKVPYWHRHVTTNLTFDQVKEAYGIRVLDRIKECFNILEVKGSSLRK